MKQLSTLKVTESLIIDLKMMMELLAKRRQLRAREHWTRARLQTCIVPGLRKGLILWLWHSRSHVLMTLSRGGE
ncbi:MAG: hypothetical protein E6I93_19990 [Chloroflexi bacterium]|nr:MAG: hypothetical protein E6I93_19990 [Chloroflexota bacterium]